MKNIYMKNICMHYLLRCGMSVSLTLEIIIKFKKKLRKNNF